MSFLLGLFGKSAIVGAGEATVVTETGIAAKSTSIFGSIFKGVGSSSIFSSILSAGSTIVSSKYEMYAAIAGGLFLVISNVRKK